MARRFHITTFDRVVGAALISSGACDADLQLLKSMRHLEQITIGADTSVTAKGVAALRQELSPRVTILLASQAKK